MATDHGTHEMTREPREHIIDQALASGNREAWKQALGLSKKATSASNQDLFEQIRLLIIQHGTYEDVDTFHELKDRFNRLVAHYEKHPAR